jgi:uncharacterized protein
MPLRAYVEKSLSTDFVKGLERFQALRIKLVTAGVVLYNGEQPFSVRGVRVLNPLHVEDTWEELMMPLKGEKR